MSAKGFWGTWFKPAGGSSTRKWTLEELRELYDVLLRNGVVTESNRAVVVETIRTIAEYILWGDQNEPRIFDFFLENNILTYLHRVLLQPSNRSGEVAKQVLQTLSIIIQNVRSETGIFFLFSNNHINAIVDLDFDFHDDEVLGYYVSFLKTISLKLNAGTVHFFLNSSPTGRRFPLYGRAIRLAHNREGMVRAAVRSLTLQLYSVGDDDIIQHVTRPPADAYFGEVGRYLAEQVQLLDRHLASAEAGGSQALSSLDSQLAEVEDVLSYAADLLSLGVPAIAQLVAAGLWQAVVWPLLLRPLLQPGAAACATAPPQRQGSGVVVGPVGSPAAAAGVHLRQLSWGSAALQQGSAGQAAPPSVRPVCAVFVLERLFQLVTYQPLLAQLLLALTCPPAAISSGSSEPNNGSSASCRSCLLGLLAGGQAYPAVLVLRLLVAALNNRHMPPELLAGLGVLPRKHHQQQEQQQQEQQRHHASASSAGDEQQQGALAALVQAATAQLQAAAAALDAAPHQHQQQQQQQPNGLLSAAGGIITKQGSRPRDLLSVLTQQYLPPTPEAVQQQQQQQVSCPDGLQALEAAVQQAHQQQQGGLGHSAAAATAAATAAAAAATVADDATFAAFGQQLLPCLMQLLALPSLPPFGLWLLGWLLHQLLPVAAVAGAAAAAAGQRPADGDEAAALGGSSSSSSVGGGGGGGRHSRAGSSVGGGSSPAGSSSPEVRDPRLSGVAGGGSSSSGVVAAGGLDGADEAASTGADSAPGGALPPPLSTQRAASVQSNINTWAGEPRASMLTAAQQAQLQGVLDGARAAFAGQLAGMWCEAVFPLLALEWPAAREALLRPVLRAGSHALLSGAPVWPLLRALQQQQAMAAAARGGGGGGGGGRGGDVLSMSAAAALDCYLAVQRVVALSQMQELLRVGAVACAPPVPTVSEADLKQVDIQEGYQVDLAPGSALPCVVSFAPGQERRVYFAVAGLSWKQLSALQGPPSAGGASPTDSAGPDSAAASAAAAAATASNHATLLRSLPVAVLADPSPSRPQAGVVLSVAPLLGAHPYTDGQVPKWLHVHVRPSVRGLLRIIKTASGKKGGLLSAMRQLADGHWVLAFSAGDKAALAVTLVQQHSSRLQALYGDALVPLCGTIQHAQQQQQQPDAGQDAEPPPPQQQHQQGAMQEQQQDEQRQGAAVEQQQGYGVGAADREADTLSAGLAAASIRGEDG